MFMPDLCLRGVARNSRGGQFVMIPVNQRLAQLGMVSPWLKMTGFELLLSRHN